jgi:hypothetical protein
MSRIVGGVLALALVLPALGAADKPGDGKAASPEQQYQALAKEFTDAQAAFMKAYRAAKTQEERQKVIQEKYPDAEKAAGRFMELAGKYPKDPAAVSALVWVVTHYQGQGKDNPATRALATLMRDHAQSDRLAPVCDALVYHFDPESEAFLRTLLEKNPSPKVQGHACLALAMLLKNHASVAQNPDEYEGQIDKDTLARLKKADPAKLTSEAEGLFDRAARDYAKVDDVAQKAGNELFEIRHLAVGREAPEVEGMDADGKKFKLSDYRGKVVLLDFWGNW